MTLTLTETLVDVAVVKTLYATELPPVSLNSQRKTKKSVSFHKSLENIRYFRTEEPVLCVRQNSAPALLISSASTSTSTSTSISSSSSNNNNSYLSKLSAPQFNNNASVSPIYSIRSNAPRSRLIGEVASKVQKDVVVLDSVTLRYPYLECAIFVKNIAFHKRVLVHYTLDNWATCVELDAKYDRSEPFHAMDRFIFSMDASPFFSTENGVDAKTFTFAIRYETNGQTFWDNNGSSNYQINFLSQRVSPQRPTLNFSLISSALPSKSHLSDSLSTSPKIFSTSPISSPPILAAPSSSSSSAGQLKLTTSQSLDTLVPSSTTSTPSPIQFRKSEGWDSRLCSQPPKIHTLSSFGSSLVH